MNRLLFIRITPLIVVPFAFINIVFAQEHIFPKPNPQQIAWQKAELGIVFHYDLHVLDSSKYVQTKNRLTPVRDYNIFNPQKLDVNQWVLAAKNAGAKFAILTATHETGFALFQSAVNPYSLKAVKWKDGKADIVKDFVDACRKHDIKPGIYLGIRWNSFLGVHDFKVDGTGEMQKQRQQYYNNMVEGMVKEICTNYGELFEIWFDGGASSPEKGAPDVLPIVKKYQPNCLFYHNDQLAEARWGGSESGTVGYPCWSTFTYPFTGSGESAQKGITSNNNALLKNGDPNGKYWVPAMADAPLRGQNNRHEWFWEPGDEHAVYPLDDLIDMYYKSVGRNATLIIGVTPDDTGLVPVGDFDRLKEFGAEIDRRFKKTLGKTSGTGKVFNINLGKVERINQIAIGEAIEKGERVRKYKVEALINRRWLMICDGFSIGNKRIQTFNPLNTNRLRLTVEKSIDEPIISFFKVYHVSNEELVRN